MSKKMSQKELDAFFKSGVFTSKDDARALSSDLGTKSLSEISTLGTKSLSKINTLGTKSPSEINTLGTKSLSEISTLPPYFFTVPSYYINGNTDYERFLRDGYTVDPEWQKILDRAAMTANYDNYAQLNSYADIISNALFGTKFENQGPVYKAFQSKGYISEINPGLKGLLKQLDPFGLGLLPALFEGINNAIPSGIANLIDYTWQYNIKPIIKGEWNTFKINSLVNMSESLDYMTAPIKGVFIDKLNSNPWGINWGTDAIGRKNYDYNTGNKALDVIYEVFSDPGVWATLGGKLLITSAMRASGEIISELSEALVKTGVKELSESVGERATKQWLKRGFKKAVSLISEGKAVDISDMTEILIDATKPRNALDKVLHPITVDLAPEVAQQISADAVRNISEILVKVTKQHTERAGVTILRTIDKLDTVVTKATFAPVWATNRAIKKINKTVNTRALRVAEPFIEEKGALSPFDYNKVMSKVDEVNGSLIDAVEQQGLKSFDNAEMQKAFYKYTKEDLNNIQGIIKKYSKGVKTDYVRLKQELIASLLNRHGFEEILNTEAIPNIVKQLRTTDPETLTAALTAYLKNPYDGDAIAYIRKFFPENTHVVNVNKFITDNIPIEKMLSQYADVLEDISKQVNLFDSLKGSLNNVIKTYSNLRQAEDFVKSFANSSISVDIVNKAIKALANQDSLRRTLRLDLVDAKVNAIINDAVHSTQVSEVLKKLPTTDVETTRAAIELYLKNPNEVDAKRYLELFLPEGSDLDILLDDVYNEILETYEVQLRVNEIIRPIANAFGIVDSNVFKNFINQSFLTDAFKKVRLPEITAGKSTLSLTEATDVFKQDVVNALRKYYDAVTESVEQFLKTPKNNIADAQRIISMKLYDEAYIPLKESLSRSVSDFNAHYKALLDDNPVLKSNLRRFEEYGKELLSTSGTQKKVTDLVKNIAADKKLPETFESVQQGAETLKQALTEMLEDFKDLDTVSAISMSEDSDRIFIEDVLRNTITDLEAVLKSDAESFDLQNFQNIIQHLDNVVHNQQKRIAEAIAAGEVKPGVKPKVDALKTGNYTKFMVWTPRKERIFNNTTSREIRIANNVTPREKRMIEAAVRTLDNGSVSEGAYRRALEIVQQAEKRKQIMFKTEGTVDQSISESLKLLAETDDKNLRAAIENYIAQPDITKLKALSGVYDKLETLVNNAYDLIKIPEKTFSLIGDTATYALKLEQTWNTLTYLSSSNIMDFVYKAVNRDTALSPTLLEYFDSNAVAVKIENAVSATEAELHKLIGEACAFIQRGAHSITEYEQLLDTVEKTITLDHTIREALITTLNHPRIAQLSVDSVASNTAELFSRLFEGIENYVNAGRKTERYTLDAFRNRHANSKLFETRLGVTSEVWAEMAHHSDADVITSREYFKKELPDFKIRNNDVFIDMETSGLDKFQGETLEVSLDVNGTIITFKRNLNPEVGVQGLSNKLLELYAHGESDLNIVRNNFYNYYSKNYKGPQAADVVYYFDSEADLLQAVQSELYKVKVVLDETGTKILKTDPNAPRLLGHNISGFDIDFLKLRAEQSGLTEFESMLGRFEHVDSYKLVQEKHGFLKLDAVQQQSLKDLLSDYITARTRYADTDVFELYHAGEDFINAIPNELTVGLKRVVDNIDALEKELKITGNSSEAFASDVSRYVNDILKELKQTRIEHIKKPNMAYAKHLFTEDQLNTNLFKSQLIKILKQDPHYKKFTKQQLADFVKYLNPTKAFYAGHELINRVGFKKVFDPKLVRNWFEYVNAAGIASTTVPQRLGQIMFNTAKRLERTASYIKNPKALSNYTQQLDTFIDTVKKSGLLERTELRNPALKYIINDPKALAIADKYSLAEFLRQVLGNTKTEANGYLIKLLPEDVVAAVDEVIANKKLFISRTIKDTDLTFAEITKNIASDEDWISASFYAAKADEFAQNIESFNLVDDFDKNGIFSPEKQIFAQGAQKVHKLYKDYADWVEDATVPQLYDAQAKLHFITENLNKQTLYNVLQYDTAEELLHKLVWSHGAVFNINEAPDIARKLMRDESSLKEVGVLLYREGDYFYIIPDRRVLDIRCELRTVDDITTKHVLVGKKGMPLQEVAKPVFEELDIDTAIKLCKEEFTLELGNGVSAVTGAIDDVRLTELGTNLKQAREGINTVTRNAFAGVNADIMEKKTLRHLYEHAPKEVQDAFGDINDILDSEGWFSETSFNLFNLGSTSSKRFMQPGTPAYFLTSYDTTAKIALKNQETRFRFVDMMLNNDMRLDIGVWAEEANNDAVIKYLNNHPELTVAVLHKANNTRGYNIRRITINTVEDLRNARRLHASVLTNRMYSRTASVIYSSVYDSGFLNGWAKLAKLYKIGQLSVFNLGTLFRNFVDSTLKMFITTRDITGTLEAGHEARKKLKGYNRTLYGLMATSQLDTEAIERIAKTYGVDPADVLKDIGYEVAWYKQKTIKDVVNASILYEKYNTALDEIIKMDSNAVMRPQNIEFYFNYMSKELDKESFYEVHKFITQGASAGNTSALEKVFAKDAGDKVNKNIFKQIIDVYSAGRNHGQGVVNSILDSVVHVTGKFGFANEQLEQIIRLTQHMQQMRSGFNFAESNLRIAKTHFDYADKTDITKSMELIFPYYSFKMKNFEYWADLIETQPWVMHLYEDVMTPIWDFDSYDTYAEHLELANNESLAYHILAGNIILNDSGLVLKLNPSIADAIQMATSPFGTAQDSLWSPFNEVFKTYMLELWKAGGTNEFIDNTFGLNEYNYEHQRTKLEKVLYNLPLIGPTLQRQLESKAKYQLRADSVLLNDPSLFGAVSRWNLENIRSPEEQEARLNELRLKYAKQQFEYYARRAKWAKNKKGYYKKKYYKKKYYKKKYYKRSRKGRRGYKNYKPKNYYYNSYNSNYKHYTEYYKQPYNRQTEHSLINKVRVSKPKRVYRDNIYWKYYTKSGKRRMDILTAKTTRKNLQMKIKLMYDYYR